MIMLIVMYGLAGPSRNQISIFGLTSSIFLRGELKDEIGRDQEEFPVSTKDKLPMTWGKIKAQL